jgi:hypothetical protein
MLTYERLREVLQYDPETGEFMWLITLSNRCAAGKVAGWLKQQKDKTDYLCITIDGRKYRAARLAWFYIHGVWPSVFVDHEDRDGLNNREANLRLATNSENMRNTKAQSRNRSGVKGVSFYNRKWIAEITVNGRRVYRKGFGSLLEAATARASVVQQFHNDFSRL